MSSQPPNISGPSKWSLFWTNLISSTITTVILGGLVTYFLQMNLEFVKNELLREQTKFQRRQESYAKMVVAFRDLISKSEATIHIFKECVKNPTKKVIGQSRETFRELQEKMSVVKKAKDDENLDTDTEQLIKDFLNSLRPFVETANKGAKYYPEAINNLTSATKNNANITAHLISKKNEQPQFKHKSFLERVREVF